MNSNAKENLMYVPSSLVVALILLLRVVADNFEGYVYLMPFWIIGTHLFSKLFLLILNKEDFFSPSFVFYAFSLVFFFWAPVNQLIWDYWPSLESINMRYWVAVWGWTCIFGLILLEISKAFSEKLKINLNFYYTDEKRVTKNFIVFSIVCIVAQVIVLWEFGGISGYVNAYEMRVSEGIQDYNPYSGFGFLFTLAESFPNLLAIYLVWKFKDSKRFKTLKYFVLFILVLFFVNMLFGGLRGSRSTTIWSLFWGVSLYHFLVRPLGYRLVALGVLALWIFMSTYSLFKFGGVEGLHGIYDPEVKAAIYESRHVVDADKLVLVRDASRADVQSYIISKVFTNQLEYSYGRSLIAGAVSFVPSFLFPSKPDTFVKEKTDIFWGEWFYAPGSYSTLLTGLNGEFIVNFGLFGSALYFVCYGIYLGLFSSAIREMRIQDSRIYLTPVLILCVIQFLMSDSNVIAQYLFRYLSVPALFIFLSSKKGISHVSNSRV